MKVLNSKTSKAEKSLWLFKTDFEIFLLFYNAKQKKEPESWKKTKKGFYK